MTDVAVAVPVKTNLPKKASKVKKPAVHPKYCDMVTNAISTLKERGGSSRQAILTYICKNYKMADKRMVNSHLKLALRAGVKNKSFMHGKGTGAAGSFKLVGVEKSPKITTPKSTKSKKITSKPKKVIKVTPSKIKSTKSPSPKKLTIKKSPKKVSKKIMKTAKPKRIVKKVKTPKKMTKK